MGTGLDRKDESTILRFRHLLEKRRLTERIFAEIRTLLEKKSGTIADATILSPGKSGIRI